MAEVSRKRIERNEGGIRECKEKKQRSLKTEVNKEEEEEGSILLDEKIIPMPSIPPKFGSLVKEAGIHRLDSENFLIVLPNILSKEVLEEYLASALKVDRVQGKAPFGSLKPRKEVCYTPDGTPYNYSKINHYTTKYPSHVLAILPLFMQAIDSALANAGLPPSEYRELSSGVDIKYDSSIKCGGSIAAHRDDEDHWGMVVIHSLGQTRYLRVRRNFEGNVGEYSNVELSHNSLVVMYGPSFQKFYTHQVDKLSPKETIGTRLSLNVRYLKKK